jgi:small subunit ribosomal protein S17
MALGKKLLSRIKRDGERRQETEAQAAGLAPATTDRVRRRNEQVGTVVKARMQKTVVVAVERLVQHGLYRKTIKRTSTFMAHDEKGAKQGDLVRIVETRPLSKNKRWRVEEIVGKGVAPVEDTADAVAR